MNTHDKYQGMWKGFVTVITLFFIMLIGIPIVLFVAWRRNRLASEPDQAPSLRRWMAGEF